MYKSNEMRNDMYDGWTIVLFVLYIIFSVNMHKVALCDQNQNLVQVAITLHQSYAFLNESHISFNEQLLILDMNVVFKFIVISLLFSQKQFSCRPVVLLATCEIIKSEKNEFYVD